MNEKVSTMKIGSWLSIVLFLAFYSATEGATIGELLANTEAGVTIEADGAVSFLHNRELGYNGDDDYYYVDDDAVDDDIYYYDDDVDEPYPVNIRGTIQITFWGSDAVPGRDNPYRNGVTSEPTSADLNRFMDVTEQFFLNEFDNFAMTRDKIADFRMGYLMSQYYPASSESDGQAKFLISFLK